MGGHPGLHVDGGHGVGHHVVQLAGNAQPLLVEAAAGILFGPVADGGHVGVPVRHRDPGEQRRGDHERDDVEPAAADVPGRVVGRSGREQDGERREGRYHRPADADLGGHRVQGEDGSDQRRAVDEAEQRVDGHRADRDGEGGDRRAAPPGQGQAGHRDEQEGGPGLRYHVAAELEPVRGVRRVAFAVAAEQQEDGHRDGEKHVADRQAEPSPPHRHHYTFHAGKTKHAGRFRRPPPVGGLVTPPGVRRARLIPRGYRQVPSVAGRPAGGVGGTLEQQLAERPPAP